MRIKKMFISEHDCMTVVHFIVYCICTHLHLFECTRIERVEVNELNVSDAAESPFIILLRIQYFVIH